MEPPDPDANPDAEPKTVSVDRADGASSADSGAGSDAPTPQFDRKVGRYVLVGTLGSGGMGVVYRAFDPQLDRFVALKLVLPRKSGEGPGPGPAERLIHEARLMARLSHPNVLKVHDVGMHRERVYLAMELIDGVTLRAWLRARPRSWQEVTAVFVAAGRGLAAAHEIGLVHRDFKPDNVLISESGQVFVADFGVARLVDPVHDTTLRSVRFDPTDEVLTAGPAHRTGEGIAIGTPAYMAPEQHLAKTVDASADQFAYCVALYEALTGERPFRGKSVDELVSNVMRGKIEGGRATRGTPRWLIDATMRGLERDPSHRHASMRTLLELLEERPRRARRRLRIGLAGAPLLVASLGTWAWQASAATRLCSATAPVAAIADGERKENIVAAFAAADAEALVDPVLRQLDERQAEFDSVRERTCVDVRVHKLQSSAWGERVQRCLARFETRASFLAEELAHADARAVVMAANALAELGSPERCTREAQYGSTPATPATADLARTLDRLWVRAWLGHHAGLVAEESDLMARVEAAGDERLGSELQLLMALRRADEGDPGAITWFFRAIWSADAAGADRLGAQAWVSLHEALHGAVPDPELAEEIEATAAAAVVRGGADPIWSLRLATSRAEYRLARSGASSTYARVPARQLDAESDAEGDLFLARQLSARARGSLANDDVEAAASDALRALALAEEALGDGHPMLESHLLLVGDVFEASGHAEEATRSRARARSLIRPMEEK